MEQKKEKKYIVGSIICGLLTAFGIVALVISLLSGGGSNGMWILTDCAHILLFAAILYYAFIGYKKPHGNMLKYIILIRAVMVLPVMYATAKTGRGWVVIFLAVTIGLSCYIAGRLNRVKENTVFMIINACIMIGIILCDKSVTITIGAVSPLIIWLDICVAYFLRYKQHREAGLEDAPKK